MLVCLTCSLIPTSLSQTDWGVQVTGCNVPWVPPKCPADRPCPYCFLLTEEIVKKEGNITQRHKGQKVISTKMSPSPCWVALQPLQGNDLCFMSLKAPLHIKWRKYRNVWLHIGHHCPQLFSILVTLQVRSTLSWDACAEANLSDWFVSSFRLVSKELSRIHTCCCRFALIFPYHWSTYPFCTDF